MLVINIISRIPSDMTTLFTKIRKRKKSRIRWTCCCYYSCYYPRTCCIRSSTSGRREKNCSTVFTEGDGKKNLRWTVHEHSAEVNTAGVIPIIFASSLMQFPIVIATFAGKGNGTGIGSEILRGLNQGNWCNPQMPKYSWGLAVYIILTVFFAYFYTSITFNPLEIANNMKKNGGFIPGIRPGKPTVEYLTKILNYIIFVGACGLVLIQLVPIIFNGWLGASVSFGGTSLIIIVSVILETLKQIESQMLVRNYKGFLNK